MTELAKALDAAAPDWKEIVPPGFSIQRRVGTDGWVIENHDDGSTDTRPSMVLALERAWDLRSIALQADMEADQHNAQPIDKEATA